MESEQRQGRTAQEAKGKTKTLSRIFFRSKVMSKLLVGVFAFVILFVVGNTIIEKVEAHANHINSVPAPNSELDESPDRVIIWFSEPIEESFSVITVLNSAAERVDLDDSARDSSEPTAMSVGLPPLENGTYTVVWKNLSAVDGHKVIGSYVFSVGEPISAGAQIDSAEQPLLQTVSDPWLRWLIFVAAAIVMGGLIFEIVVSVPVVFGESSRESWQSAATTASDRWSKLSLIALGVMIVVMVGQLLQQTAVISGDSAFTPDFEILRTVAFDSSWGRMWIYRMIAVVAVVALLFLARRTAFETTERDDEYEQSLVGDSFIAQLSALFGLVFLGLISASSHNAASPSEVKTLATATDFIHLVSSMVWLGGVIYLAISVPILLRNLTSVDLSELLNASVSRFTLIAVMSAGTLVVTGIFSSYMQVTAPAATATPYGWFLVGKILLIIPLFGLAAANGFRIAKRFGSGGEQTFRKSLLFETGLVVAVFVAVGWLASLEPARQYAGRMGIGVDGHVSYRDSADATVFDIEIEPAEVGKNDIRVQIARTNDDPIDNAVDVRVRLKFVDDDLGEPFVSLRDKGNGLWELKDAQLNIAGEYQAEVVVQRPDAFDSRTAFRFDAASASTAADAISPDTDTANLLFGIQLLLIGGIIVLLAARKRILANLFGDGSVQPSMGLPGVAVVVIGLFFILNVHVLRLGLVDDLRNPFPPTADSVAIGEPIYFAACAACHGDSGLGDGTAGVGLPKEPADLIVHVPLHSDTILYEFIRDGISEAGMPGQEDSLTEDEMWHLVNYLRAQFDN
ncbi:MAG: hypothetical protein CL784_05675 [Chloroflexi bacterium]|nr:hypothetical protein [Chloroflexota bacterium]|tara:strand:+ start:9688 stop:12078 length:2391 start_codon:yes stop_codon:yes gene_type:complete